MGQGDHLGTVNELRFHQSSFDGYHGFLAASYLLTELYYSPIAFSSLEMRGAAANVLKFSDFMASKKVVFIEEDPAQELSRRERYLRNSVVRSQAARYSHGKRNPVQASRAPYVNSRSNEPSNDQIRNILFPTIIGQGRTDPFDSQALKALHPLINQAVDRSKSVVWLLSASS